MQDLLKLDNLARTNFPSTVGCNWRWRMIIPGNPVFWIKSITGFVSTPRSSAIIPESPIDSEITFVNFSPGPFFHSPPIAVGHSGYLNGRTKKQKKFIRDYYGVKKTKELPDSIIRSLFSCIANVVIIQILLSIFLPVLFSTHHQLQLDILLVLTNNLQFLSSK